MKNNLVSEIEQIVGRRQNSSVDIPMPTYLYVEHYGRNIEDDMKEITALLGEKDFFVFKMSRIQKLESWVRSFQMKLEKHAALGKEFSGCVLVELTEEMEQEELPDFLEFVSRQEDLRCLFTMKKKSEEIQQMLEQYFFVRVVEGQKYDCVEQLEILNQVFAEADFIADIEAMKVFEKFFAKKEWQEGDMVQNRIQNIAKNLVYEKMMQEEMQEKCISKEDAENVVKKLLKEPQKRNVIGFCV